MNQQKPKFTHVRDIPDTKEYTLVTDSQEVSAIKEHIGASGEKYDHLNGLFVKTGNAEYVEVWGFNGSVPYMGKKVTPLH